MKKEKKLIIDDIIKQEYYIIKKYNKKIKDVKKYLNNLKYDELLSLYNSLIKI